MTTTLGLYGTTCNKLRRRRTTSAHDDDNRPAGAPVEKVRPLAPEAFCRIGAGKHWHMRRGSSTEVDMGRERARIKGQLPRPMRKAWRLKRRIGRSDDSRCGTQHSAHPLIEWATEET
uniref:Uncharacterized protein n=1 Tax=Plectus sambesii TaxID=2011161 RepID=A0A914W5K4_9BILA